jgi:hypothetical protein
MPSGPMRGSVATAAAIVPLVGPVTSTLVVVVVAAVIVTPTPAVDVSGWVAIVDAGGGLRVKN